MGCAFTAQLEGIVMMKGPGFELECQAWGCTLDLAMIGFRFSGLGYITFPALWQWAEGPCYALECLTCGVGFVARGFGFTLGCRFISIV